MKVKDHLKYFARIKGFDESEFTTKQRKFIKKIELWELMEEKVKRLDYTEQRKL